MTLSSPSTLLAAMNLPLVSYYIPLNSSKLLAVTLTVRHANCLVLALLPLGRSSCVISFQCRRDLMIVEQAVS